MIFHVDTFYSKQVRILNMIELQAIIICYILEIINKFSDINNKCEGKILYRKVPYSRSVIK